MSEQDLNNPATWGSTLLLPTLNEIEALETIVPQLDRSAVDEILCVDGGSTDGTIEYMESQGITVLKQTGRGYGCAMQMGLRHAANEIIVEFTPDGNAIPARIPDVVAKMREGYDLVVASRYADGARSDDDSPLTAFGNKMFTTLVNVMFRARYTDVLVGFRAFRKSVALDLDLTEEGLSWPCESSIKFARAGLRVCEVGCTEPPRIGGERKMIPHKTGMKILRLIVRERLRRSPAGF
ncbi:MAG: glycosyltransferase family 2 protein [Planctomycetes bacterium]|nr:glycosyltransferase family 2 protein [Planctomycetota bacterium]